MFKNIIIGILVVYGCYNYWLVQQLHKVIDQYAQTVMNLLNAMMRYCQ